MSGTRIWRINQIIHRKATCQRRITALVEHSGAMKIQNKSDAIIGSGRALADNGASVMRVRERVESEHTIIVIRILVSTHAGGARVVQSVSVYANLIHFGVRIA